MKFLSLCLIFLLLMFGIAACPSAHAQSAFPDGYQSAVEKRCSKCNRVVPSSLTAGDTCPFCGVRWGEERPSGTDTSVVEKRCSNCNRVVPSYMKMGDTCPFCHVRWGEETDTSQAPTSSSGGGAVVFVIFVVVIGLAFAVTESRISKVNKALHSIAINKAGQRWASGILLLVISGVVWILWTEANPSKIYSAPDSHPGNTLSSSQTVSPAVIAAQQQAAHIVNYAANLVRTRADVPPKEMRVPFRTEKR